VAALLEQMGVLGLGTFDPCVQFAILSVFADAESEDLHQHAVNRRRAL
jgi:hypothetical protein